MKVFRALGGLLGGVLLGVGVALLLVVYGKIAFGTATPYIVVAIAVLLGLASAVFGGRKAI